MSLFENNDKIVPHFVWTNILVLEFIELYKREDILWDPKHPLNKNRNSIALAWKRIKDSLSEDCHIVDLKKKKESLMTTFRLHINRKRKSHSYKTCWFAFSAMESFLGCRYEFESPNQSEDSSSESENQYFKTEETHDESVLSADPMQIQDQEMKIEFCKPKKSTGSSRCSSTPKTHSIMLHANKKFDVDRAKANKHANSDNMDEYELYGQLLAKKLKKLNEHQRDLAMHEIDMIMFRIKTQNRMECVTREHSYSESPPLKMKPVFIVSGQNDTQYEEENLTYHDLSIQPQSS